MAKNGSYQHPSAQTNHSTAAECDKEKRTLQEVKLADMHMKRRVPQIYLSRDVKQGKVSNMNDFNSVLKKSLLSPQKQRYIATMQE